VLARIPTPGPHPTLLAWAKAIDALQPWKVFAATELPVLLRNRAVDPLTRDLLAYYDRCLKSGQSGINTGFIAD
jgi:hypothetical protein